MLRWSKESGEQCCRSHLPWRYMQPVRLCWVLDASVSSTKLGPSLSVTREALPSLGTTLCA